MSVAIPKLTDDKAFKDAKKERERRHTEVERLKEELGQIAPDASHLAGKRQELGAKYKAAQDALQDAGNVFQAQKRRTGAAAAQELAAAPGYQKLVLTALEGWADARADWLALSSATTEARRAGIEAQPLPPVIAVEIAQVAEWAKAAARRGSLDAKQLPASLKALVKEG